MCWQRSHSQWVCHTTDCAVAALAQKHRCRLPEKRIASTPSRLASASSVLADGALGTLKTQVGAAWAVTRLARSRTTAAAAAEGLMVAK
jgi:hypothetical protein